MLNTQGGGSKYTKYTVFLACEQIHSKYTAKYTVSGGGAGGWHRPAADVELYSSTALQSALHLYSSTALYTLHPLHPPSDSGRSVADGVGPEFEKGTLAS